MPHRTWAWLGILLLSVVALWAARPQPATLVRTEPGLPPPSRPSTLDRVRALIHERGAAEVDDDALTVGAIRGMLHSVDPYSDYLSPDEPDHAAVSDGQYVGIGIEFEVRDGVCVVLTRYHSSPAALAGILPGDLLRAVNGDLVERMTPADIARRLAGSAGSTVRLTIERSGETYEHALRRVLLEPASVTGWRRAPDDWNYLCVADPPIGYIRIRRFQPRTAEDVAAAMERVSSFGAHAVVLDLRFNAGGHFESAIRTADVFLSDGVIVAKMDRLGRRETYRATSESARGDVPLIVLVNRFTASSAEILAGSLQANERALVVGERTWGKAAVQSTFDLEDGQGHVKITTGYYVLSNGRDLHRRAGATTWGVEPDIIVPALPGRITRQMETRERLSLLASTQPATTQATPAASGPDADVLADPQMAAAVNVLLELSDADENGTPATQPSEK